MFNGSSRVLCCIVSGSDLTGLTPDRVKCHSGAEQHTLLLKDEGTLEVAVQSLKDLWNEGRPSMLLDENIITAQQSLISIILELAECSG